MSKRVCLCCLMLLVTGLPRCVYGQVQGVWIAQFDGGQADSAVAVAVDGYGNVYVTGTSQSTGEGLDYVTIKYNASGNPLWTQRYNGSGNWDDTPVAIALDNDGNVFVTGYSWGTNTDFDFATVMYKSNGTQVWVARSNRPGLDKATAMAVDPDGSVFVTGQAIGASNSDFVTIKYNNQGNVVWGQVYDSGGVDGAKAIALDASGDVFVTGSVDSSNSFDYATLKYRGSDGQPLWPSVVLYDGPDHDADVPTDIAVDASGDVFVTGTSFSTTTYNDYATVKYNGTNGQLAWPAAVRYDASVDQLPSGCDGAWALALDSDGNVYVTGGSQNQTNEDYLTIKYKGSNGLRVWTARYDGTASGHDRAFAIAADSDGDVYIAGTSAGAGTGQDYATVKYDSDTGQELWDLRYNGSASGEDDGYDIAVDGMNNVYVTGKVLDNKTGADFLTFKLTQPATKPTRVIKSEKSVFELDQNVPNPFNPTTTIRYRLVDAAPVKLTVYNSLGQAVRQLVNAFQRAGTYEVVWDGRNALGHNVATGIYVYRLEAGHNVVMKKMVLSK